MNQTGAVCRSSIKAACAKSTWQQQTCLWMRLCSLALVALDSIPWWLLGLSLLHRDLRDNSFPSCCTPDREFEPLPAALL